MTRGRRRLAAALGALVLPLALAAAASAREAAPLAQDPVLERRLAAIAAELRCLVCQNESLADSRAPLAMDLRREVRELIRSGATDREVREFLVARYGDFVLYRPPVAPRTWLLWAGPFVLLAGALGATVVFVRRSARRPAPLSPSERAEVDALLQETRR